MRSAGIVEAQVSADRPARFADASVGVQVDFLVLHRAPQPLDHDIVAPGAAAVHADGNLFSHQNTGEGLAGELAALVRIENLRFAIARQSFLERFHAKVGLQRDRDPVAEDLAAEPVNDSDKIDEALGHGDVADVCRPDLIRLHNRQFAQKIGVDLVPWRRLGGAGAAIDRLDRHLLHQARDMAAANLDALLAQEIT